MNSCLFFFVAEINLLIKWKRLLIKSVFLEFGDFYNFFWIFWIFLKKCIPKEEKVRNWSHWRICKGDWHGRRVCPLIVLMLTFQWLTGELLYLNFGKRSTDLHLKFIWNRDEWWNEKYIIKMNIHFIAIH
jgi:hypothetical protein